ASIGHQRISRPQYPDNRLHRIARRSQEAGMAAQKLHELRLHAHFFPSLAQGGLHRVKVSRFDTATRKTDLPGMVIQVRRATCEHYMKPVGSIDQRNEDSGLSNIGAARCIEIEELGEDRLY